MLIFLKHVKYDKIKDALNENFSNSLKEEDAQLSQRDRAAGCVIVFAKSRRLELGNNILQTL